MKLVCSSLPGWRGSTAGPERGRSSQHATARPGRADVSTVARQGVILKGIFSEGIVVKRRSGRACAALASKPSAPRSGGGARRGALMPVSTRGRCWHDDAAGDHGACRRIGLSCQVPVVTGYPERAHDAVRIHRQVARHDADRAVAIAPALPRLLRVARRTEAGRDRPARRRLAPAPECTANLFETRRWRWTRAVRKLVMMVECRLV